MNHQLAMRLGRELAHGAQKSRIPCRYHASGYCSKGNACQFAHEGPAGTSSSSGVARSAASQPESSTKAPCRFYAAGKCTRREWCPFAHEEAPKPTSPAGSVPVVQPRTDSRSQIPCQYFAKGYCRNGDACPFAHTGGDAIEGVDKEEADGLVVNGADIQEEPSYDDWIREFGGALVKFEDGAAISKVSHPSEFSAVRLSKLPDGSSPASVAALLSNMDVTVSLDNIRVVTQTGVATCTADVTVEDPEFAKTVCSKLRTSAAGQDIEAVPIPVPMPRGSSLHRVNCRRVHCSWHRPTRTAWLNFGTEKVARKVQERFDAGIYKVSGFTVKAKPPTGQGNSWNPLAWTVMLPDLPGTVTERDVYQAIPEFNRPRHIEMGKPSYDVDVDLAATIVKSMLLQLGPLEWWDVSANSKGKRIKAQARFFDESHAREAVSSLDKAPLSFSKTAKLTVRLMISAKFKISARIYDVLRERLEPHRPAWESQHLRFVEYPPQQGYRVLKLEGEDAKQVAQAKNTLERIIEGEVVRKGGTDVWSAGLGRNGDEYRRLKQIEQEHGVVIVRDRRKRQLRVFGSDEGCRRACKALEGLIQEEDVSDSHVIELNSDEFQWACRGGFKALASRLGDNKPTFDIVSTPKRILIDGSKADYTTALAIIANRQTGQPATPSDTQTDCSVCWTEADEPVRTSCDHVYCMGCFSDMCHAESSSTTEFRISCVGGQGQCKHIFALSELQDLLSSTAFESLLSASFASYIRRHPSSLRYCPTPDCGQIYRAISSPSPPSSSHTPPTSPISSSPPIFTCPKCLIPTCTSCHTPHPNQTCADHREFGSGGREELAKTKKQLGIKDCPRCKTAMEKTDGCNHMTCRGCGAHLCWVCLAAFDTSEQCYGHLSKMHGGCF